MMNEVDGMKLKDYYKDWCMHTGMNDLLGHVHVDIVLPYANERAR